MRLQNAEETGKNCSQERSCLRAMQIGSFLCVMGCMGLTGLSGERVQAAEELLTAKSYQMALQKIISNVRWAGTEGEREAAGQIADLFSEYGYVVRKQEFPFTEDTKGKQDSATAVNVEAIKTPASEGNGDILIISAHHDSKACTEGANDDASGEAMLLELARVLKDINTDTEIRFVSFSAEEQGLKGSSYYVSQLSEEDKAHIIGDIQIDMIGHYMSDGTAVATAYGSDELLADLLKQASKEQGEDTWELVQDAASDHASFTFAGIPAVQVKQTGAGEAENHRFIDNTAIVDADKAVTTGKVIEQVVRQIASEETESLLEEAKNMNAGAQAVQIKADTPILFGVEKSDVDVKIGASGTLEKEDVSEYGYDQAHYVMQTRWFDWEALPTDFVFRKSDVMTLDRVFIRTGELGLSDEELGEKLTEALGEPEDFGGGQSVWGSSSMADNPSLRQYIITRENGEQVIEVTSFIHVNVGEDIQKYDFAAAQDEYASAGDDADRALLEAVHKVIPDDDPYMGDVISWTDGYSYVLGSCTADEISQSDRFSIRIDKNDFFNSDGSMKDTGKFLATAVHEYGHELTLNKDQMDVSGLTDTADYNDIGLYLEDSYMKAFYDKFYADGKAREFYSYPEDYVSEYAGTAGMFEDIAESFMQFVVSDRQTADTLAAQKVNFFYDYPELMQVREYIRSNFGYQ